MERRDIIIQDKEIQKSVSSASIVMLTLFWDFNGPVLKQYQDHGQMINSARYCTMLEDE